MSLLLTKPRYFPTAIATESGWINPITKELLVSVGGLKSKLAAEAKYLSEKYSAEALSKPAVDIPVPETISTRREAEPVVEQPKEVIMEETKPVKVRKEYTKKIKVVEQTEKAVPADQKLLGEVVEHDLDKPVIGE
jgi:hypothetical protein